ncbi:MAG: hypothetical protein GY751_25360 [Bacteroidetes bacterium]|nr:hypothetical protein [Bacteroidota bacterium]
MFANDSHGFKMASLRQPNFQYAAYERGYAVIEQRIVIFQQGFAYAELFFGATLLIHRAWAYVLASQRVSVVQYG